MVSFDLSIQPVSKWFLNKPFDREERHRIPCLNNGLLFIKRNKLLWSSWPAKTPVSHCWHKVLHKNYSLCLIRRWFKHRPMVSDSHSIPFYSLRCYGGLPTLGTPVTKFTTCCHHVFVFWLNATWFYFNVTKKCPTHENICAWQEKNSRWLSPDH